MKQSDLVTDTFNKSEVKTETFDVAIAGAHVSLEAMTDFHGTLPSLKS